jgi:hypothetical protein
MSSSCRPSVRFSHSHAWSGPVWPGPCPWLLVGASRSGPQEARAHLASSSAARKDMQGRTLITRTDGIKFPRVGVGVSR